MQALRSGKAACQGVSIIEQLQWNTQIAQHSQPPCSTSWRSTAIRG
jgi:hypothetical protein